MSPGAPFTNVNGLTVIPAYIINHMPGKLWDESTYHFSNFNGATADDWARISNLIHILYIMDVNTYLSWD